MAFGWAHTKILEKEKILALNSADGDYDSVMEIPYSIYKDIDWWLDNIDFTYNPIRTGLYGLEIFTDVSKSGWGAWCKGKEAFGL